jgi:hypothetical protein
MYDSNGLPRTGVLQLKDCSPTVAGLAFLFIILSVNLDEQLFKELNKMG